jgi:DNA-binding NtrC family response regulator
LDASLSAVVLDYALGEERGTELLDEIRTELPLLPIIMVSGIASVEDALEALNRGASDFIEKPIRAERLLVSIETAIKLHGLRRHARDEALPIAESEAMRSVVRVAARAASSTATVLLSGESGTGKDRVARLIHALSPRARGPLVKINCGALPRSLAESELFGHKKGAFTGAVANSPGKIYGADGGTLFLDEIGELPLDVQVKLLRFLETGDLQRVGDHETTTVSTRLIAASNRVLSEEVERGAFREDLYYRLNVVPIHVPPVRERVGDIAPLARYFAATIAGDHGLRVPSFTSGAVELLEGAHFPGNVRELRNIVERLVVMADGSSINEAEVATVLQQPSGSVLQGGRAAGDSPEGADAASSSRGDESVFDRAMPLTEARRTLEQHYLERQLARHDYSVKRTAEALSMIPANLSRRLSQLGIRSHQ